MTGTRTGELLDAVAARCERLVNGAVTEPTQRHVQRRLIGVALFSPFVVAAAGAILLTPLLGVPATLGAGAAMFAASFVAAAAVSASGTAMAAGAVLLAVGTLAVAALVAVAGGAASPAALLVCGLAFESWWVGRNARAALAGAGAAVAALAASVVAGLQLSPATGANAAVWLLPIAYLALAAPRLAAWAEERADTDAGIPLEDLIEAVVLRMDLAGEVTDASAQAQRVLGLAPELLLSSGVFDRMHVADRVAYLCALADLRAAAGFRRVFARMRVPGSAGHVARDFRPFVIEMMRPDAGLASIAVVLRAQDEVEPQRHSGRDAVVAETRDVTSTRMLASVSHELRTPLNCIIGFSDMLMHEMVGPFADPRQKEYVALVRESGNHLLSVVNSILDVSRLDAGAFIAEPESFAFADAVAMCRSMLAQQAAEKRIGLATEIAADAGQIFADRRAVRQMLINLVSNAVKFTPEGGSVEIGARRVGQRLDFWVSDTGIGIGAGDLEAIGEPFTQVRNDYTRRYDGSGLGLSLVKGLVALHHGSMSIESEPGQGTTVRISLPIDQRKASDVPEIQTVAANRSRKAHDAAFRKAG